MRILGIDPSVNNIGVALWEDGNIVTRTWHPPFKEKEFLLAYLPAIVKDLLRERPIDHLVVEYPSFHTSTKGKIAAQKGYTLDLAFVAGLIASLVKAKHTCFPTPMDWKGQTPKDIVGVRFHQWSGYHLTNDHEFEAAMMIKYVLKSFPIALPREDIVKYLTAVSYRQAP